MCKYQNKCNEKQQQQKKSLRYAIRVNKSYFVFFSILFVVHTYPMLNRNTNKKNNIIAYNNNNKNYFL